MGEVGVHLEDEVGPLLEGPGEARGVGPAEPLLALPVEDRHAAGVGRGEGVGDLPGAVGGAVVHDEDPELPRLVEDARGDEGEVLPLLVGGEDDDGPHRAASR